MKAFDWGAVVMGMALLIAGIRAQLNGGGGLGYLLAAGFVLVGEAWLARRRKATAGA